VDTQLVVFDGDDTLWETEFLYDAARNEAAAVVAGAGIDPDEFKTLQRKIDVGNVARLGLLRERFPTSSVEAYETLARRHESEVSELVALEVYRASATVFDRPAPLLAGAREVLESLTGKFHLALLTKGDLDVQNRRVADSGLASFFSQISIVSEKDSAAFQGVLDSFALPGSSGWSVGNSLRSDILPAVAIGMRAIWVDAYVWAHELNDDESVAQNPSIFVAAELKQVPALVDPTPAVKSVET
jgi:putative hydrolase of the HAD superfamily